MTTIREILIEWMEDFGADGLCNPGAECGCCLTDLAPCDCINLDECVIAKKNGDKYFANVHRERVDKLQGAIEDAIQALSDIAYAKFADQEVGEYIDVVSGMEPIHKIIESLELALDWESTPGSGGA